MGLFTKLTEQLDINEYKSRAFEENELRHAEKMIFEGYFLPILENDNKSWKSYDIKRVNLWAPKKDPEKEKLDNDNKNLRKENDDLKKKKIDDDEKAAKNQEYYDEEFDYLFKRHIDVYKEYYEQVDDINSSSLDENLKKQHINKIRAEFSKYMRKLEDDLRSLNNEYRGVHKHKLNRDIISLDINADVNKRYV